MKMKPLGTSDIRVSEICLGTMTFGEQNSEAEGFAQMDMARDRGINFLDTAELYPTPPRGDTQGETERIIGKWMKARGARAETIVGTKIAGPGPKWIRGGKGITPQEIDAALHASLRNLQTDYIDLYQLHWPQRGSYHFSQQWTYRPDFDAEAEKAAMRDVLERLSAHVQAGKIRAIGLSNETAWGTMHWLRLADAHGLPRMISLQNEYSLLCRLFEPDLQEIAMAEQIGLLAWSPLATGLLTGKYMGGARPVGSRWALLGKNVPRNNPRVHEAVAAYKAVADAHDLSLTRLALAFVRDRPFTTSTIIGATTMAQLEENIAAFEVTLSEAALRDIGQVYRDYSMVY